MSLTPVIAGTEVASPMDGHSRTAQVQTYVGVSFISFFLCLTYSDQSIHLELCRGG